MIALDEDGAREPFLDGRSEGITHVLALPLLRVGHLRASKLEEHDLAVVGQRGAECRAHGVKAECAHVDRRRGAMGVLTAPRRQVDILDRGWPGAEFGGGKADDPAGSITRSAVTEHRRCDQAVNQGGTERTGVLHGYGASRIDGDDAIQTGDEIVHRLERGNRLGGDRGLGRCHGTPPDGGDGMNSPGLHCPRRKRPVAADSLRNRATGRDVRNRCGYSIVSVPTIPAALWPGTLQ